MIWLAMIATPDNLDLNRPLPPVPADMVDSYVRELEHAEQGPHVMVESAKNWLGEHPKLALGAAIGLGIALGVVIKRVRKW